VNHLVMLCFIWIVGLFQEGLRNSYLQLTIQNGLYGMEVFFNSERTKHEQINLHFAAVEKFPLFFLVFLPRLSLSRDCLAKINMDPEWYQSISFLQGCLAWSSF
jgi:hypothetical protein